MGKGYRNKRVPVDYTVCHNKAFCLSAIKKQRTLYMLHACGFLIVTLPHSHRRQPSPFFSTPIFSPVGLPWQNVQFLSMSAPVFLWTCSPLDVCSAPRALSLALRVRKPSPHWHPQHHAPQPCSPPFPLTLVHAKKQMIVKNCVRQSIRIHPVKNIRRNTCRYFRDQQLRVPPLFLRHFVTTDNSSESLSDCDLCCPLNWN